MLDYVEKMISALYESILKGTLMQIGKFHYMLGSI